MQRLHGYQRSFCTLPSAAQQPVLWTADATECGSRLDRFIKRRAPGLPQGLIQRLIRQRRILVNNESANRNNYPIHSNDRIRLPGDIKLGLSRGKRKPPPTDVSLAEAEQVRSWILYRDARCIVLNKPAGLPTQGGTGITGRHLEALLPGLGEGRYWLVHRLDRDVAGAMVVARDVGAAGLLAEAFRRRSVQKVYWALVRGVPSVKTGVVEREIEGKACRTAFRVVETVDKAFCWLELMPWTGRKHQIRIHCADVLQTPIVGDDKYGGGDGVGLHLAARQISFPRLIRAKKKGLGDVVTVQAPLPGHMKDCWKRFGLDERLH